MKKYFVNFIKNFILSTAMVSANTMSQLGLFEPRCPDQIKRFKK